MAISIGGVPCEVDLASGDSLVEAWTQDGPQATVRWKCPWGDRYKVAQALRGFSGGGLILPHQYPDSTNLYCLSIGAIRGIKPKRADSGFISYAEAVIEATYGVPTITWTAGNPAAPGNDCSGKAFYKTSIRSSAEYYQLPIGTYFWRDGPDAGKPVPNQHIAILRPRLEIVCTRLSLPVVPTAFAQFYTGTVNSTPIKIGDHEFPVGTVMFGTMNIEPSSDSDEAFRHDCSFVLMANGTVGDGQGGYLIPEWNQYVGTDGGWYYIETDTGIAPYIYGNFWDAMP